jgi:hypothetical protein
METDEQLRIRDECRDLGFAYAVFVDLRRFTELAALFMPDGILHRAYGETVVGRANIEKAQAARPPTLEIVHQVTPAAISVTAADEAQGWSSFIAVSHDSNGEGVLALRGAGFFEDRYRKWNGLWLIAERRVRVIGPTAQGDRK